MTKINYLLMLTLTLIVLPYLNIRSQPEQEFYRILHETRTLTHERKRLEACDLFESVSNIQLLIQNKDVNEQEVFLYERAQLFLDVADGLANTSERHIFAKKARDYWKEYIDWYHSFSDSCRSLLNPENKRIIKSTAFFGNAIVLYDPSSILIEYLQHIPDINYFGPNAVDKWCMWLYRCPDLREVRIQDRPRVRREKVCNEDLKDFWLEFADFEEKWASTFDNLSNTSRDYYLRDANKIRNANDDCE